MTALPNIPRLYTALAECLAVGIYALPLGIRFGKTATIAASAAWALALSAFLQATGSVPLAWWIPCMAAAVGIQYLYLWVTRTISLLEAGYVCARAFVLAELAASAEWQLHCFLWPQRSGADGSQLGFLSTRELCTLVGAPLDNAIESVLAEPDPEKRLLRVAIYNQSGCVMLRFENYCAQPVEMGADGLPVHNAHGGYDLQGVQAAAQRHDGTMTLHWADGWFTLRILLPVPS